MSTKCSLAYGDSFHLYEECFDEDNVYLKLEGVEFEATAERVTVTIPIAIWETIREYTILDLSYADKSDEEIQAMVEEAVDRRIEEYNNCDDERQRNITAIIGAIPYGLASSSVNEQIEKGLQYFLQQRERQSQIKEQITALKKLNSNEQSNE